TTTICLRSARSMPTIALLSGTRARSRASRALRLRSPRDTPLPLATNVLLMRGTPSPKRIRRTFPRPGPTRRTSFYAAWRAFVRLPARVVAHADDPPVTVQPDEPPVAGVEVVARRRSTRPGMPRQGRSGPIEHLGPAHGAGGLAVLR